MKVIRFLFELFQKEHLLYNKEHDINQCENLVLAVKHFEGLKESKKINDYAFVFEGYGKMTVYVSPVTAIQEINVSFIPGVILN